MDQATISHKINEAIRLLSEVTAGLNQPAENQPVLTAQSTNSFDDLKSLLFSDKWPNAVNPNLICDDNSEDDKKERGNGIVELVIEEPIPETGKFLDFGCGEGHCVLAANESFHCTCVGYDIKSHNWPTTPGTVFTTDFEAVKANGPYDVILIFDLIDHVESETPEAILEKAKSVLADNGKIYLRTHPWISRHGTHVYKKLNKAFIHVVFTEDEIAKLVDGYTTEQNSHIIHPLATYDGYFKSVGLNKDKQQEIKDRVEPFFNTPMILQRITANTNKEKLPEFQMSLSFVDYTLSKQA